MKALHADFRIQGARIYLRPITVEDTEVVLKWRNSENVVNNFIYRKLISRQEHLNWLENKVNTGKVQQFIICENTNDMPLGSIYLQDFQKDIRCVEEGIFLGEKEAFGRGIGVEATKLLISYVFDTLQYETLTARVLGYNSASRHMFEKCGFQVSSLEKDKYEFDGKKADLVFYELKKKAECSRKKKVSFVIPCYRSEKTLPGVIEEIRDAMNKLPAYTFDIFLVNDCSPDQTFRTITELCGKYDNITGINLAKNFGQHAALMAGLRKSDGDIVVCLDDDGQTPADEVGKLLAGIEEGSDVVYASYGNKKHSAFRNFGSWVNDLMTRVMLGKPKELHITSYFAARRFVVNSMLQYEKSYPYVIGLVLRATKNITNVPVTHRSREVGASGYTMKKLLGLWFNGFTAFSIMPLRIASVIGTICAAIGFLYGIYTIIKKLVNPAVPLGFSSMMAAIVFFGGMIMIILGLIGEYVGRIYISINNSPQYVIREEVGKDSER